MIRRFKWFSKYELEALAALFNFVDGEKFLKEVQEEQRIRKQEAQQTAPKK
jgi:hypothetical protein